MISARAVLVFAAALAAAPVSAGQPASAKAKRLTPADPAPAAIAVPDEPKVTIIGSCALGGNACSDYEGAFAGVDVKALCAKAKGTWSSSACPAAGIIGNCTQREVGSEDRVITRTYAPGKVDAAKKACVNLPRGIFLPAK
jgi:hypothetical protein